jgi:hypothetical protein
MECAKNSVMECWHSITKKWEQPCAKDIRPPLPAYSCEAQRHSNVCFTAQTLHEKRAPLRERVFGNVLESTLSGAGPWQASVPIGTVCCPLDGQLHLDRVLQLLRHGELPQRVLVLIRLRLDQCPSRQPLLQ